MASRARVIATTNQKGGVCKTTTALAIAHGLQKKGFKVLAVDLDPQANLTFSVGGDGDDGPTVYEMMKGEVTPRYAIQRTGTVDLIAANILLAGVELEFTQAGREFLLKEPLDTLRHRYDFIVIDTPPALSALTINAFTAADYIVIPMLADIFSLQGIAQLNETIQRLRVHCNPELQVGGILLVKYNPRTVLGRRIRETAEMVAAQVGTRLYRSKIRSSVAIPEAQTNQVSMFDYAPRSPAVMDYMAFVGELLEDVM